MVRSAPCLADLSLNCVIRLASPKPVRQFITQASWACSGTWLCTKRVQRSGSSPAASSWAAASRVLAAQLRRVLRDGDRVQVHDHVERVVGLLERHPLAHRAEVVAEVEGARGGLDAGEDPGPGVRRRGSALRLRAVGVGEVVGGHGPHSLIPALPGTRTRVPGRRRGVRPRATTCRPAARGTIKSRPAGRGRPGDRTRTAGAPDASGTRSLVLDAQAGRRKLPHQLRHLGR